jgi:hypothetical protein
LDYLYTDALPEFLSNISCVVALTLVDVEQNYRRSQNEVNPNVGTNVGQPKRQVDIMTKFQELKRKKWFPGKDSNLNRRSQSPFLTLGNPDLSNPTLHSCCIAKQSFLDRNTGFHIFLRLFE